MGTFRFGVPGVPAASRAVMEPRPVSEAALIHPRPMEEEIVRDIGASPGIALKENAQVSKWPPYVSYASVKLCKVTCALKYMQISE